MRMRSLGSAYRWSPTRIRDLNPVCNKCGSTIHITIFISNGGILCTTAKYSNKSDSVYSHHHHQHNNSSPANNSTAHLPRISSTFGRVGPPEKGLLKSSSPLSSSQQQQVRGSLSKPNPFFWFFSMLLNTQQKTLASLALHYLIGTLYKRFTKEDYLTFCLNSFC